MIDPTLREDAQPISDRLLRQFAALCVLVFGGLSLINLIGRHRSTTAAIFAVLAAVGIAGLVRPRAIRSTFFLTMTVTKPIGWGISQVLLAAIFYLVFTPLAVVFRMTGRDPLCRARKTESSTYWRTRTQPSDVRDYLYQS
jgi:hypothetical protein